jgi:hypothetical protein
MEQVLLGQGDWHWWERRCDREMCRRMNINAKMISVQTVLGITGGEMKESSGGSEFKSDIFDIL